MKSSTAAAALGMISGFGLDSYFLAIDAMMRHLAKSVAAKSA